MISLCDLLGLIDKVLESGEDALRMLLHSVVTVLRISLGVIAGDTDHADTQRGQIIAEGLKLILQVHNKGAVIAHKDDE